MTLKTERTTELPINPDWIHRWWSNPGTCSRLQPPWIRPSVRDDHGLHDGARITIESRSFLGRTIQQVRVDRDEQCRLRQQQVSGPWRSWEQVDLLQENGDGCSITTKVDAQGTMTGSLIGRPSMKQQVRRLRYQHERIHHDHAMIGSAMPGPMRIGVTGSSGLVGSALVDLLRSAGHVVLPIIRSSPSEGQIGWDPGNGILDPGSLEGLDAIVHLAGAPIAAGRWSPSRMKLIHDSRVDSTRLLARTIASMSTPPSVVVSASAIGFYGGDPTSTLDEDSPRGPGFLADVVEAWESAAAGISDSTRLVTLRIGMVLSSAGGALGAMLPLFKAGLGGPVGSGRQVVSWISLDDLIGLIFTSLHDRGYNGIYNAVSPGAVTNREFARCLGHVLGRPAICPAPSPAMKLVLGSRMATELLLQGSRIHPSRLEQAGFSFLMPELDPALRFELGRM